LSGVIVNDRSLFGRLLPPGIVAVETRKLVSPTTLFADELEVIASATEKRRHEFAGGRVCAREALLLLGIAAIPVRKRADGRPAWPHGVVGSITHTDQLCAAACGPSIQFAGIGIDAEHEHRLEADLWPTVCTARELRWLRSLPPARQPRMATTIFSAKEAVYKCRFESTQAWLDFADVEIGFTDQGFEADVSRAAGSARRLFGRYAFAHHCVLTAVVEPA
jgi:4'-phosphopantetheinyl transferase EntD